MHEDGNFDRKKIVNQPYVVTITNNPDYKGEPDPSFAEPSIHYGEGICLLIGHVDENGKDDGSFGTVLVKTSAESIGDMFASLDGGKGLAIAAVICRNLAAKEARMDAVRGVLSNMFGDGLSGMFGRGGPTSLSDLFGNDDDDDDDPFDGTDVSDLLH